MRDKFAGIAKKLYYYIKYKDKNIKFGKRCIIGYYDSVFEGNNRIGDDTYFHGKLGYASYIGNHSSIDGVIGRYCSIANNVCTVNGTHPTKGFVSTHPSFFSTKKQAGFTYVSEDSFQELTFADNERHHVVIGNDVWIGYGAILLGGIKIGNGAIIAAGALVNKDVEPYAIVGGVPAKLIRRRFTEEQIEELQQMKWWDKPKLWIQENAAEFSEIEKFLSY